MKLASWTKVRSATAGMARLHGAALVALALVALNHHAASAGTLVNFNMKMGSQTRTIQVDLFDDVTQGTVDNFLDYVNAARYSNTVIHRYAKVGTTPFVLQGGGYKLSEFTAAPLPNQPAHIQTFDDIDNEFTISSNVKGTLAMAKLGTGPNTATSEWFFNLGNNAGNLDSQNGGFTVFGWIVGNGLTVLDELMTTTPTKVPFPGYVGVPDNQNPFLAVPKNAQADFIELVSVTIERTHASFQNPIESRDVNNNGTVTPHDLQLISNSLTQYGSHNATEQFLGQPTLPNPGQGVAGQGVNFYYHDVNGDGKVTPRDLHLVYNAILAQSASALAAPLAASDLQAMPLVAVPEPTSLVMGALGGLLMAGGALARWRQSRRAR